MSITSKATKLLTNKYFLYFIVILASMNVFGYLVMNQMNAVIFFALVGLVMSFFSKNMIVILIVCMVATNLITSHNIIREGLANPEPSKKEVAAKPSTPAEDNTPIIPLNDDSTDTSDGEPAASVSAMSSMNKKSQKNGSTGRIDYASTLEEAYDNLDKILGTGGINKLTGDTENLMKKQQELFESMKMMTPMVQQAQKMLEGFDLKSLEGLAGLATSFTPAAK